MEDDERFKHILTDPKFRRIPKHVRKVKIDKRFQSMFKDKSFKIKYTTDKRGKPVEYNSTEDLKRYYDLSEEDSEEESSGKHVKAPSDKEESSGKHVKAPSDKEVSGKYVKAPSDELEVTHEYDKSVSEETKKKLQDLRVDYARGESKLNEESSSDDESEEEPSEADVIDHKWGELDLDAGVTEEATHRLAACNMDWDRIRAVDLIMLFNSFLPNGGAIKSVAIYPSEFGKQRMKEEELKGPIELVESKTEDADNDDAEENEEGSSYHMEKLRQYQLNRLKYYYAVITFDSANSANKIYSECDGMEYESSAIKLDLRFVPEGMEFEDEPKDLCDRLPEVNKYHPRFFTTTALQQAKVNLTWDETNPDRIEFAQKLTTNKHDQISEADFRNYLASSSSEDEDIEEGNEDEQDNKSEMDAVDKYKALLQSIEEKESSKKEKDVEMEISWGINVQETAEKRLKEKQNASEDKTPFQKYLDKRKEKRKEKRKKKSENHNETDVPSDIDLNDPYFAEEFNKPEFKSKHTKNKPLEDSDDAEDQAELELLLMNEDDNKKHFDLKKIQESESDSKKKRKGKKLDKVDDNFEINVEDERFSALFTSHHYNIDPTDSHYKKTKAMETLINEKLKRRVNADDSNDQGTKKSKQSKEKGELSLLVNSVKRKAQGFPKRK